jgi:hypothetical protein
MSVLSFYMLAVLYLPSSYRQGLVLSSVYVLFINFKTLCYLVLGYRKVPLDLLKALYYNIVPTRWVVKIR